MERHHRYQTPRPFCLWPYTPYRRCRPCDYAEYGAGGMPGARRRRGIMRRGVPPDERRGGLPTFRKAKADADSLYYGNVVVDRQIGTACAPLADWLSEYAIAPHAGCMGSGEPEKIARRGFYVGER